ncbi:DUF1150 domain-containing protein [Paramagnetospirillum kuznetsovii]|uniref:DUF1150 domain-containing protein n=1 Tax=Paramagnetospirillum kuznetsovii TaxID=2053833 RepID=A0A364P2R5_9PROT|nr:DUF1150 family protein [Paramagnetospirillum kuznetsovii]RAU23648.1 DUF1150 domain-containing protein [Paramagnetospirillum kuznetsovii]
MKTADNKQHDGMAAEIMTTADLASWGLPIVAYVRHQGEQGAGSWTIHAADGTTIGAAPDRATAFAAVRQHELEPLSVH